MQESKTLERRGLAKGLKIWIDILFFLSALSAAFISILWPLSEITGSGDFQMRIPVSIGASSLRPIHRLEVSHEALIEDMATDSLRVGAPSDVNRPLFTLVNTRGELRFDGSRFAPWFIYWVFAVTLAAVLMTGLFLLRQILAATVEGRPFHPANPQRLNLLGWIILLTGAILPFLQYRYSRWVLSHFQLTGPPISASFELQKEWIFFGLLVLVLAAIWKEAVRLAEDQALTV